MRPQYDWQHVGSTFAVGLGGVVERWGGAIWAEAFLCYDTYNQYVHFYKASLATFVMVAAEIKGGEDAQRYAVVSGAE